MIIFPKRTIQGYKVSGQLIFDTAKSALTTEVKNQFRCQIDKIVWANRLARDSCNLTKGNNVEEIEVFRIALKQQELDGRILDIIDENFYYHFLFLLEYNGLVKASICGKHRQAHGKPFKVDLRFETQWMNEEELPLRIAGSSTDMVYAQFVCQVSNGLIKLREEESLEDAIQRRVQADSLEKQIATLKKKVNTTNQFSKQMQLNKQLKSLKDELASLL